MVVVGEGCPLQLSTKGEVPGEGFEPSRWCNPPSDFKSDASAVSPPGQRIHHAPLATTAAPCAKFTVVRFAVTSEAIPPSKISTARRLCCGARCEYRIVMAIVSCPANSYTVRMSTPAKTSREIEFNLDEEHRRGFHTSQLIDYTLEPNPDPGEDKNAPPQRLALASSTGICGVI